MLKIKKKNIKHVFIQKLQKKHKACFYNYDVNISTRICYMLLIPECDKQTDAHTDRHMTMTYTALA